MAKIGEIYSLPLGKEDDITPKGRYDHRIKYCVVIATPEYGYYVAYLVIDHEINEKFNPTKLLKDCFYPLSKKDYPGFIRSCYDPSWLDMSKIREMEKKRLDAEGTKLGELTQRDLELVMESLRNSEVLTTKQKRRCGLL